MPYSLGKLGFATGVHSDTSGASQTSLKACNGGSASLTKMSEFFGGHTGVLTPTDVTIGGDTVTAVVSGGVGSRFVSRIAVRAQNYDDWTSTRTDRMYPNPADQDYTCQLTIPGAIGLTSTVGTSFRDYYNQNGFYCGSLLTIIGA